MRSLLLLAPLTIAGGLFLGVSALTANANGEQVTICHVPPGNPENGQTITVGAKAAEAHLRQHELDMEGTCPEGMGGSSVSLGVLGLLTAGWAAAHVLSRRRAWRS